MAQHVGRRILVGVYRRRQGTAVWRLAGTGDFRAHLSGLFPYRHRSGAYAGFRERAIRVVLLPVCTIRNLPSAALPDDAHHLARRALLDDRLGLELRLSVGRADGAGRADAGARFAMARSRARAVQDAPQPLWRPAGPFRGHRLGILQAWHVAVAVPVADRNCAHDITGYRSEARVDVIAIHPGIRALNHADNHADRRAVFLRFLQSNPVALVGFRSPLRRCFLHIRHPGEELVWHLLEGSRLDFADLDFDRSCDSWNS